MNRNSDDDSASSFDSLATPRAIENDDAAAADPPRETFAELFYVNEGNRSLKSLAILSLGLTSDDGSPLFNPSILPWSAALRPSALKKTADDLRNEVKRRCVAGNVPNAPRPKQWTVAKSTDWLEKNPIVADNEVAYIKTIIAHRITVAQEANLNASLPHSQPAASSNVGTGNWIGKYPHLRLIHAIVDDNEIKTAYLHRLVIPNGRMAIKNRRTVEAIAGNVWTMVANKWNDPLFQPTTSVKGTHSDFARAISIPFDSVCKFLPATPEKVEEKWNAMNLALKRAIQNWERSGQGDGGYTEEEEGMDDNYIDDEVEENGGEDTFAFGSLTGRPQKALDLRRNFFDDKATYLLYLWDILEEHGLTQSTMQQLLEGVGSGNGSSGVPSVIGAKRNKYDDNSLSASSKKSRNNEEAMFAQLSSSINKHSNSLVTAAKIAATEQANNCIDSRLNAIRSRINSLRDTKRNMVIRMSAPDVMSNKEMFDAIAHEVKGIEEEIATNVEELDNILSTPVKRNRSPK